MANKYLAIDFGASSGRLIISSVVNGKIVLKEMHRFDNGPKKVNGHLCWDIDALFNEVKTGLKKCGEAGEIPDYLGVDTWGVDYVLLDKEGKILGPTYSYRDHRTKGMDEEVYKIIPEKELYARTGIQKAIFNTVYQLMAVKLQEPENMEKAETFLHLPDYFEYLLTGIAKNEYTEATTGNLVNPKTHDWDYELIEMLGFNKAMFKPLQKPGTVLGHFKQELIDEVGFDCEVVMVGSHDTASAVLSVPILEDLDNLYISSGTWSLMGIENKEAILTPESQRFNLTNEGGYDYRFRYLKNIMGLWMIQQVRHETGDAYTWDQLAKEACRNLDFPSRVNVDDDCFLAPDNMTKAIQDYCRDRAMQVPESIGEIASVVYQSLVEDYSRTVDVLEEMAGRRFNTIHIVGGGSMNPFINGLTARRTGRTVVAGPGEATAIGNVAAQMIYAGEFEGLKEVRKCIYESFGVREYKPEDELIAAGKL
ncbi:MAG: rhamnulokinase [Lachnospiraceae bacterium]|nr:rhamnulokinase [Lachnospiraceae bacterium]